MPRKSIDYSKTKFYKLVCKDLSVTFIYVGHTTDWIRRKNNHKCNSINENSKYSYLILYKTIRENGGWDNWSMILIEEYSCENKLQASQRERHWIETLNATLNQYIPSRTQKERMEKWNEEHKEDKKIYNTNYYQENREYYKQHYEENKEQIKEKAKEKIVCECGAEVCKYVMVRHRQSKKHQDYMNSKESA